MKQKPSRYDLYDRKFCTRGLANALLAIVSNLYEFAFHLTFMRTMKDYRDEFKDPWDNFIDDFDFFSNGKDLYAKQCIITLDRVLDCKQELIKRWGINEFEDLPDPDLEHEQLRYEPYYLIFKRSKSYKRLTLHLVRAVTEIIHCLYLYACVFTVQSYQIPQVFNKQYKKSEDEQLRLLNDDDNNVALLKELILRLQDDLKIYKLLIENKGKLPAPPRRKRVQKPQPKLSAGS